MLRGGVSFFRAFCLGFSAFLFFLAEAKNTSCALQILTRYIPFYNNHKFDEHLFENELKFFK